MRQLPWPVIVFFLGILVPPELSIYVGELRISAYRWVLLAAFIPCLISLFGGRCGAIRWSDWAMVFYVSWAFLGITFHHGLSTALQSSGIYIVEGLGAYALARRYIRDEASFSAFVHLFVVIVIALALFTIPESITGHHFLRWTATKDMERRMGLARAYGPFDHPILYGVFCASTFALGWYAAAIDYRWSLKSAAIGGMIIISTIMSVSSGALAAIVAQASLIIWDRASRGLRGRWLWLIGIILAGYLLVAATASRAPITVLIWYLTLDRNTAYGRTLIWQYGSAVVTRHPVFGIGFNDWARPAWMRSASVDNFWLLVAMRYGIPAVLFLGSAVMFLAVKISRRKMSGRMLRLRMGWLTAILGICIAAVTVDLWNSVFVVFCFTLGSGAWLLNADL